MKWKTSHYIEPRLIISDSNLAKKGDVDQITFQNIIEILTSYKQPIRMIVSGGPGSGKTTFLREIAIELSCHEHATVWIDASILSISSYHSDPNEFIKSLGPPELPGRLWESRVRKGRILVLID